MAADWPVVFGERMEPCAAKFRRASGPKSFFVPKWNKRVPAKYKNAANDDHEKQTKNHAAWQKRKIHFV